MFILRLDREANAALETLGAPLKNWNWLINGLCTTINNNQQPKTDTNTRADGERAYVTHRTQAGTPEWYSSLFLWATQFVLCVFGRIHARAINIRTRHTTTEPLSKHQWGTRFLAAVTSAMQPRTVNCQKLRSHRRHIWFDYSTVSFARMKKKLLEYCVKFVIMSSEVFKKCLFTCFHCSW